MQTNVVQKDLVRCYQLYWGRWFIIQADAEEMFALLKQYGVRLAVEDTIQLENMLKSANEFETFKLLDAAEHIRYPNLGFPDSS